MTDPLPKTADRIASRQLRRAAERRGSIRDEEVTAVKGILEEGDL